MDSVQIIAGHEFVTRDCGLGIVHPDFTKQYKATWTGLDGSVSLRLPDLDLAIILGRKALQDIVAFVEEMENGNHS